MAYPRWFGATTRDGVQRWQVLIVDLAKVLIIVAILGVIPQSVTSFLLFSEGTTHRLISCGMMMGSTAVAVTIVAIAVFRICVRRRVLAFVIVASRYAFLVSAANALWLEISIDLYHHVEVGQLGFAVWPANRAGLFLTMAQSVLSLIISCICLTWGDVRSRNISQAVVRIISGFVILPVIAFGCFTLSTKLHWPALTLLAWSFCLMILGILNAILVSYPHYIDVVDPGKLVNVVIKALEVINVLFASVLFMISIGGFKFNVLGSSGSLGCIKNINFECSPLMTGIYGLCLIMAIEEGVASILSLTATYYDGTSEEDVTQATLERQQSLPPSYEELFSVTALTGSGNPNEDCCSLEVIVSARALRAEDNILGRQESLPPQYKDVVQRSSSENHSLSGVMDSNSNNHDNLS